VLSEGAEEGEKTGKTKARWRSRNLRRPRTGEKGQQSAELKETNKQPRRGRECVAGAIHGGPACERRRTRRRKDQPWDNLIVKRSAEAERQRKGKGRRDSNIPGEGGGVIVLDLAEKTGGRGDATPVEPKAIWLSNENRHPSAGARRRKRNEQDRFRIKESSLGRDSLTIGGVNTAALKVRLARKKERSSAEKGAAGEGKARSFSAGHEDERPSGKRACGTKRGREVSTSPNLHRGKGKITSRTDRGSPARTCSVNGGL